jgi:hypothetical protein
MTKIVPFFGLKMMILITKRRPKKNISPFFTETSLCPKCARQGQIFPNISKRNQKLIEKVEWNQAVVIISFLSFEIPALRIPTPQVERSEIPLSFKRGELALSLSMGILPGVPVKS